MRKYVSQDELDMKQNVPNIVDVASASITLIDNTEYRLQNVSNLEVTFPQSHFEVWMRVSFATSGNVGIIMPANTQYIGAKPTFGAGQTWELSIKDGVAICWRVA